MRLETLRSLWKEPNFSVMKYIFLGSQKGRCPNVLLSHQIGWTPNKDWVHQTQSFDLNHLKIYLIIGKWNFSGMKSFNSIVIIQRKTMIEPEEMKIKQIRRESSPSRPNKSFEITLTEKSNLNNHGITVTTGCKRKHSSTEVHNLDRQNSVFLIILNNKVSI